MNKLIDLLKIESKEISAKFEKASLEGKGTPQEVADRREPVIVTYLQKYFPFPYRVVKGNIIDSFGKNSASIDTVMLNPSHPYTIDISSNLPSVIMADGVDFVVEVKPNLADEGEIFRVLKQCKSVKQLRRTKTGMINTINISKEQVDIYKQIPFIVFSNKTYADTKLLISKIVDYYTENNIPLNEQFDIIVVNDNMLIINSYNNAYFKVHNGEDQKIILIFSSDETLAILLALLNTVPASCPVLDTPILSRYIDINSYFNDLKTYNDLNEKLNKKEK